jgi:YVTN family beta-propeller protein
MVQTHDSPHLVGAVLRLEVERNSVVASSTRGARKGSVITRSAGSAALAAALLALAGCGASYRPVVSAINPVGPATQPTKYAVAVSDPGNGAAGLLTIVDVFGDTLLVNANLGAAPSYFALGSSGSDGYVLHCQRDAAGVPISGKCNDTVDAFSVSPSLMTNAIQQTSLIAGSNPISAVATSSFFYAAQPGSSTVSASTTGQPPAFRQQLPTGQNPIYIVALTGANRLYALAQGSTPGVSTGTATAIEAGTNTISNTITVGRNPVYGIMNADGRRAFVLNKADGTVSVINTQTNALDITSALPAATIAVGTNPVWADLASSINEMVVVNAGNGTTAGSLSVVNIPLCSAITATGNVNCDTTNPIDAVGFGTVLGTVPVGVNPVMVTVLQDLNKAYVANQNGTVTVVDLATLTVTKTITVGGSLNWIVSTAGTPTGKVYVTAADTQVLTIINTNTDTVTTTIPLQGKGIAVRVSAQ